ncbi:dynein light chain Tctex-type 1 isoform X2 [Bacillus rossius redtenbacheri]|uniref:dynein light chain Tctex-type 1 isoform X2 n=1 Tax=Bacillus rossius redtenbacheri TaxID=93214 RepID=UPI002FDE8273
MTCEGGPYHVSCVTCHVTGDRRGQLGGIRHAAGVTRRCSRANPPGGSRLTRRGAVPTTEQNTTTTKSTRCGQWLAPGTPSPATGRHGNSMSQFVVDEVSTIIKEAVETTIGGNVYNVAKVNQWTSSVVETCLGALTKLQKPFKYIVTCTIMQKNGAGLHSASSCFWDNSTDGSCTVRWENKTMYCIVSVYGLAI